MNIRSLFSQRVQTRHIAIACTILSIALVPYIVFSIHKGNPMKKVVLVVAGGGYQPIEYGLTRQELEQAGISIQIASDVTPSAYAAPINEDPKYSSASVDFLVGEVPVEQFDGIFLIGGPGALEHLDNDATYKLMQRCVALGKLCGAICVSPRILAHAGLLKDKKATGWNGDNALETIFKKHHVTYVKQPVVVDGTIITAEGPDAARDFGATIARQLKK